MYSNRLTWFAVLLSATLSGCTTTPNLDSRFGSAVNTAKAQQTINPNASRNADPVVGQDGTTATTSIDLYQKTFEAPRETFHVFGTGGAR